MGPRSWTLFTLLTHFSSPQVEPSEAQIYRQRQRLIRGLDTGIYV